MSLFNKYYLIDLYIFKLICLKHGSIHEFDVYSLPYKYIEIAAECVGVLSDNAVLACSTQCWPHKTLAT